MGKRLKNVMEMIKKDKKRSLLMLVLIGISILVIAWPVSEQKRDVRRAEEDTYGNGTSKEGINTGGDDVSDLNDTYTAAQNTRDLSDGQTLEAYVSLAEERLEALLSSLEGAGRVRVMITAHATRERVVGKDVSEMTSKVTENDGGGGTRVTDESSYEESSLYDKSTSNSSGTQPYIIKELVPQIEGVVVAAQGAGDDYVVDEITQAVSVLFNLPVHKIKVVKMED